MKIAMTWRGNKMTDRGKRVREKPKIRWQYLGLKDPTEESPAPSMDEIRRQAVTLSSRGLGQVVRSRLVEQVRPANGARTHGETRPHKTSRVTE